MIIPKPLAQGDTIGIVAPAGQVRNKDLFERGVAILKEMGFVPKFPRELWSGTSYLADTDYNRAQELHTMFTDPDVKGLIALRGGFGSLKILQHLDLQLLRKNPKMFVGFSDISILLNHLYENTGIVTLHGPVVTSLPSSTPDSLERLFRSLTGKHTAEIDINNLEILRKGTLTAAPMCGGNLTTLTSLLGTPKDFSWDGKILFIEDVNEPLYKIDRMFTQLRLAGKFENIAGLLLGDFSNDQAQDAIELLRYKEAIWEMALAVCHSNQAPIWANFPAGHNSKNLTFPIGMLCEMEPDKARLLFHHR